MNALTEPGRRRRSPASIALRALGVALLLLLATLVTLALVPVSAGGVESSPDPAAGYDEAVARFEQMVAAERRDDVYRPCRSRLLDHGGPTDVVVVLAHGLGSCPRQLVELGERIHALGVTVLIPRAPRHGVAEEGGSALGPVSNLKGLSAGEVVASADNAVDIASGLGGEVRVLGHSLGGVAASWIAQSRSDVERVVVVAPTLGLPRAPAFADALFVNLFGRLPNVSLPGSRRVDHAYAGRSTGALAAVFMLGDVVLGAAEKAPPAVRSVAVVTNAADGDTDNGDTRRLADAWRRRGADVVEYEFPRALGFGG